jgi:hypothetical protein
MVARQALRISRLFPLKGPLDLLEKQVKNR